jgi:hypothetical protein
MTDDEHVKALRLLSQTPSQRAKSIARLDGRAAALLILRARYLGLRASRALYLASDLECIPGSSYLDAASRAALAAGTIENYLIPDAIKDIAGRQCRPAI